jgi:hypothetical protein
VRRFEFYREVVDLSSKTFLSELEVGLRPRLELFVLKVGLGRGGSFLGRGRGGFALCGGDRLRRREVDLRSRDGDDPRNGH